MILLELYLAFVKIGLFSIGGGYASLPIINDVIVQTNKWLTLTEFSDLITLSQMTPGPISINAATFVGLRIAGFWGSVVATLGFLTPSTIIILVLSHFYFKYKSLGAVQGVLSGVRPAIIALIAASGLSICKMAVWGDNFDQPTDYTSIILIMLAYFGLKKFNKVDPVFIILGAGVLGLLMYSK